jgi:hypothetical protein
MIMNRLLVSLCLCLSAAACSSKPSESDGKLALVSRFDGGRSSTVAIKTFAKTDGQASENGGVRRYTMSFSATVELLDNAFYSGPGSIFDVLDENTAIATYPSSARHPGCLNDAPCAILGLNPKRVAKGDQFLLAGTIHFEKTEKGWNSSTVKFSSKNAPDEVKADSKSPFVGSWRLDMSPTPIIRTVRIAELKSGRFEVYLQIVGDTAGAPETFGEPYYWQLAKGRLEHDMGDMGAGVTMEYYSADPSGTLTYSQVLRGRGEQAAGKATRIR